MERNEGQRRRDSQDGYAPFVVRPALRRDPGTDEPHLAWWALAGLVVIVGTVAVVHVLMPVIR
jgi:hypothetical protein